MLGGGIQQPMWELALPIMTIEPIPKLIDVLMQAFVVDGIKSSIC